MMTGITDIKKAEIPTLTEFITVHSNDAGCHTAFASVGKQNTRGSVDSDGVLV